MSMKNHDVLQVSEVFRAPVTPFVHPGHRPVPGHGYVSGHLGMANSAFNEKNGVSTGLNMIKPSLLWGFMWDMGALYILVTTVIVGYCGCLWNWRITPKSMAIQMMDGIWILSNHHRLWMAMVPIRTYQLPWLLDTRKTWRTQKHWWTCMVSSILLPWLCWNLEGVGAKRKEACLSSCQKLAPVLDWRHELLVSSTFI